ncbi:MAG: ATP-binding cassette domain-containing protein, partial [Candidatus Aenigmatarchaeota archaeon]
MAVIDSDLCKPEKCSLECVDVCPINRAEKKCVFLSERPDKTQKSTIDESLCIDCGLCVKACPFKAISVVNTPEQLKEKPVHRFGHNQFTLFRLPFPIKGEVVGLLGPNGVGKTTALKILGGEIKPNLGGEKAVSVREMIGIFRGTELQSYLELLEKGNVKTVVKPQHVDILAEVKGTVREVLQKHDERGKTDEIVKKLRLEKILDRGMDRLSGGELQRVAIAIAANRKSDFYFIDEPSS